MAESEKMFNSDYSFLDTRQKFLKKHRNEEYNDEINNLFNKKFQFRFNEEWKLPERDDWFSAPPWTIKELEILKSRLNFHKSQLNDFDIEEWSSHTRRRNPAGEVCWKIRCVVNPEFLTQAWTKFYECASTYFIVPNDAVVSGKMVSLHLCEAPGAFITSLNHYLKHHHKHIQWKWLANTLNPYYEGNSPSNMISDDRFMLHTLKNWDFGVDNTGNLMDWTNSQAIVKRAKTLGKVLLVTADGSIDCVQKPDAQEEVTSPLHYCEIVTALQALSPGGAFIFKLFTMYEHSTVNLLYLINQLFGEVNIYKPATSREGNSEVYAVCLKFKGNHTLMPFIPLLQSAYGTELYQEKSMFPLEQIPEDFLKQIEECADYFCSIQCQVINNNLHAYMLQKNIALHIDIKRIRSAVASEFLRLYDLQPLDRQEEILQGIPPDHHKVNTNPRYHRGSYTERQLYMKMSLKEKCNSLNNCLQVGVLNLTLCIDVDVKWRYFYDRDLELKPTFTIGLPLKKINSSKFLFVPVFKLYLQISAEKEFMEIIKGKPVSEKKLNLPIVIHKELSLPNMEEGERYENYEKRCFKMLYDVIWRMDFGETLFLRNFSMLTHFNVSVLYVLSHKCFERIGLTSSDGIILSNVIGKEALDFLQRVELECDKAAQAGKAVLNSLPVKLTNMGKFFSSVVLYNNTFYRNRCAEYLASISESFQ